VTFLQPSKAFQPCLSTRTHLYCILSAGLSCLQEPGTALHTLHLTASPVASLRSLPGGGRLYVTPTLTQQQQDKLVQALQALYTQDTEQPSTPDAPPGSAASVAAAAPVAAARAVGCGLQPAAKRPRVEQLEQEQQGHGSGADNLTLILKSQLGDEVRLIVEPNAPLQKVFQAYADYKSLDFSHLKPVYKGERVTKWRTPQELGMVDNDVIDLFLDQVGC
jgi:hypothetical protein